MSDPGSPMDVAQSGSLDLIARQLVEGLMAGRHRSPWKGTSVEFMEHREYARGDEIRHIDWRAWGKTGRYFVKEFEEETSLFAWLLVDVSGSMDYAGAHLQKREYARILSAAIAWLLLSQRDSVGLVTFDSAVREQVAPAATRDTFERLIHALERPPSGQDTSVAAVVESVLPTMSRRSLLILISDCLDQPESLEQALQRCRHAQHDVIVFRLAAPEEVTFPFRGPTQFRSLEQSSDSVDVDPARLRSEYLQQYSTFATQLKQTCGNLDIDYRVIETSEPFQQVLSEFLAERSGRGMRRGSV